MLYIYDETYDGAVTAMYEAFKNRDRNATIKPRGSVDGPTLFETVHVATDAEKSERLQNELGKLSPEAPPRFYTAWLSHADGVEDLMLACARIGFKKRANPFLLRHYEPICKLDAWARKAGFEAHRMIQFVRFIKAGEGLYAADIEPEYEVLALIGNHFHSRFPDSRFVIRDVRHRQAIVSEPKGWYLTDLPEDNAPLPVGGEFEDMWRMYFKTIAIEQRVNFKLQQHFVPKKYRRFLTEFDGNATL